MNLLKALATVSGMTLLSRILGFVRDFIIARVFGAGMATDAFFVAFRLPNLLRRLFAEGAFSQAFVPILAEYRTRRGEADTKYLVDHVATILFLAVMVVTLIGMIATPLIIYITAPGYASDPAKFELTVAMTRITFPYIICMSMVAMAAGILNTWSRFALPAFTPVLLNLAMIGGAWLLAPHMNPPVMALAWAVFFGGCIQLAVQIPALKKIGMLPRFSLSLKDEGVRRMLRIMAPAVIGVSVSQISLVINTIFASFLPSGSISWIYYADRLMEFPSGLLGAALGTILLPSLAKSHASGQQEEFSGLLDWGLRLTLMLTLPCALALAILSVPLLATMFFHGAFTALDVMKTRQALVAYSVGLSGLILVKILAPAFYSRQDIKTPVKIAILTLTLTQLMNFAFIGPLQHAGLALSTGLASCVNAGLLYWGLRRQNIYQPSKGWLWFFVRLCLALLAMGGVLYVAMGTEASWLVGGSLAKVLRLGVMVGVGSVVYLGTLWLLGFRLQDFKRRAV